MTPILSASLALAVAAPFGALAAAPSQTSPPSTSPSELTALRQEIDAMRTAYEARLQALEQRVKTAEAAAAKCVKRPTFLASLGEMPEGKIKSRTSPAI